jgi:pyruvate kinase
MKTQKTKIIATVGPSCSTQPVLQSLVNAGVDCFRVNLSHGTMEEKGNFFDLVKSVKTKTGERPAILADLSGPKIRVNGLKDFINLSKGDIVRISNEEKGEGVIPVSNVVRFQSVNQGAKILINDGLVTLKVKEHVSNRTLICETLISGKVEDRKGVNFPGIDLDVPPLTKQDELDLKLSLEKGADWIALSFVRSASDYDLVKAKVKEQGFLTPIMAKIEKWEAVVNLDSIINTFDAVMVARGDLGVELPLERVPLIQKDVIAKASQASKPVIIATQILDSMTERPVPTRAEVSDIANAILDGADTLMVTGETAAGKHPEKVIKVLNRVIKETESSIDYKEFYIEPDSQNIDTAQAISHAACSVAQDQGIKILVTMTHSGSTARMAARYRPNARIIAMTPKKTTCRQLSIVWGVSSILVDKYTSSNEIPDLANKVLNSKKLLKKDEKYVITGGVPVGIAGTTNFLSVSEIK